MRFIFTFFAIVISSSILSAQTNTLNEKIQLVTWDVKMIDLGQVKKGEVKETSFQFTNTGNEPIEIELISACDCTTTDYPRLPVKPGESGTIEVVFDSAEKEESETIDIDIFLKNVDPETQAPIIEMVQYKYDLIK